MPKAFRFHLKPLKYYVSKKGMMNVHYPFIMYEATNCFVPYVVLQEGHEYLKSLGNGRAYWYIFPYQHNSYSTVAKCFSVLVHDNLPLLFALGVIWVQEKKNNWKRNTRAQLEISAMGFAPLTKPMYNL